MKKFLLSFFFLVFIALVYKPTILNRSILIKATLKGPYVDWKQQEIPFGMRSFYYAPWRSYMDTWDSSHFLDALGINFNVSAKEADATAQILSEAGIRSARVEIGWGSVDFDDESKLNSEEEKKDIAILKALQKHHIRPLILLNANAGHPVPYKTWKTQLMRSAKKGATSIYLKDISSIKLGYTGLTGMAYQSMFPIITSVDTATGKCSLSAPLNKDLPLGEINMIKFKYRPFSKKVFANGNPNPSAQETLDGWMKYVQTVTTFAKKVLGTENSDDAGFDIEVWNEYTFGSQFLNINNYYKPTLSFSNEPLSYSRNGSTKTGVEIILPMTVDYIHNPENHLPGVRVISGFSNQRPWDNGAEMWPGQSGFSRHYYTGYDPATSSINKDNTSLEKQPAINALGEIEDNAYIPNFISANPEQWFTGLHTEFVVRDTQPFPGPWDNHFRYANPNNGDPAEVWMTETNFDRYGFAQQLSKQSGVPTTDPHLLNVMQWIGTKSTLRNFIFANHKGIHTLELYAAKGGDISNGILPDAFFTALHSNNGELTPTARTKAGPQLNALKNVVNFMQKGCPISVPRPLRVSKLEELFPRLVFQGDGTPAHPNRYNRDDFAVLPYQINDHQFAIGYYVATKNLIQSWNTDKGLLDPARYVMPSQHFDLTLSNVHGNDAAVYSYDPITNKRAPVSILQATATSITVDLDTVDYPRFLMITEQQEGPIIQNPILKQTLSSTTLLFSSNVDGTAHISWGPYPLRVGGSFTQETYSDEYFKTINVIKRVPTISFTKANHKLRIKKGSWIWKGTIVPKYSEKYTFMIQSDSCDSELFIGDTKVIKQCDNKSSGDILLKANQPYRILLTYTTPYNRVHSISLYWASNHQTKELVAPDNRGSNEMLVQVRKNKINTLTLPKLNTGDGIKINLESKGIISSYPLWDYNTRGVIFWNSK